MRYEELNIGTVVVENGLRVAGHVTGGIGLSTAAAAADIAVDANRNELVLFTDDGLTPKFVDKNGAERSVSFT